MPACIDCGKETENKHWRTKRCNPCNKKENRSHIKNWESKNREKSNNRYREYRKRKKEKTNTEMTCYRKDVMYSKKAKERYQDAKNTLNNWYIRAVMGIKKDSPLDVFIELKRLQLKLRRMCHEKH